ncbi:hypothetical protein ABENE_16410 [Asticcacaulis benevestitus DSM 16100 = ATCC BAA-896]|uniref:Alpha-galactosidase n=2 Tax=Asticcacaulis TaxID=76890 RepID=V4PIW6_9CAUL|nr:hypothetical protein ABENE_16410 [Asticcacaulis benevestitus DSM 16100 = ATCC BAA-896]
MGGLVAAALPMRSTASVGFDPASRVFRLDGEGVTYAFGIDSAGQVQSLHWGGPLALDDQLAPAPKPSDYSGFDRANSVTPLEFVAFGGGLVTEPSLKVAFPSGVRDLVLKYLDHTLTSEGITLRMKDISTEVYVELRYSMDKATGLLARSAVVDNRTKAWLRVDQMAAATLNLPFGEDYEVNYLTGRWAAEWTLQKRPLEAGATVLESRLGMTGSQNNPWLAIGRAGLTDEDNGPVWFGALAWSGAWRITVEKDIVGHPRITAGYNPFDFAYRLKPGERLETPVFYAGFSHDGMGGASRRMHRFQRSVILPGAPEPKLRPVLYNSWEATEFAVNEVGQIALAEKAATLGVERFVMDDGWFGKRNNDHAGLGDWTVNPEKFPNGLEALISRVRGLGMEFGLWVEPEMVNPDSQLYRAHPDWVINFKGRPRTEGRNQLVLNLARSDVRDYVLKSLDLLLRDNDIAFLKWDHNRSWSEPGWPERAPEDQQKLYVDYTKNLYWILAELRRRHPKLEIESCAGGGGRVDLGIMHLTDQVWPTDNTDPFDRLKMQDGFSHAYMPGVMMAWVTASPNWVNKRATSLEYRFLSAMQGCLGIGDNLNHWGQEDFATAKRLVAEYKSIRQTVQRGDLYRLISPQGGSERSATLTVSETKRQAVLFTFLHSSSTFDATPLIQLQGLDPQARYAVRSLVGAVEADTPKIASGSYWMHHGVRIPLRGDFQAAALVLDVV